jgi:hypothetical protein
VAVTDHLQFLSSKHYNRAVPPLFVFWFDRRSQLFVRSHPTFPYPTGHSFRIFSYSAPSNSFNA